MGWFSKLFGAGDVAKAVPDTVNAVGDTLDKLFTSDDERLSHAEIMARIQQEPGRLQALITLQEAAHRSIFVAGWRPALGWICALSIGWTYVLHDFAFWLTGFFPNVPPLPAPQTQDIILELVFALLGLAGLRSWEKSKGASK